MEFFKDIVAQLNDMLKDDKKEKWPYHKYAAATLNKGNYTFEAWIDGSRSIAYVTNHNQFGREYPNIESYISERLLDYDSIEIEDEDEWNDHGFADAYDYALFRH